ncbi:hypothetical protein [uncultured Veillonella sp.]|uniref:hypothetical protein n=1 Tax=uncultured Veillonella sp. TaxID=159268 RepID=UPI0025E937A8|nr:hypothetical protein [uncultured Veillonella sp.]MDY3974506.1 hypothetical protein [Veillonella caviae]
MSAFLGHIHYWLYKKIRLVIERENLILIEGEKRLDDLATELHNTAIDLYGAPISADEKLEDIIDHSNIHGWLHGQIETASVREGTFIKDLLDCGGSDAEEAIITAFTTQGTACGTVAKDQVNAITRPQEIYQIMQDYYLNGMPCDGGDDVISDSDTEFVWEGNHKNQVMNWSKSSVDQSFMRRAYQAWFKAFVEAVDLSYTFVADETTATPVYKIVKV